MKLAEYLSQNGISDADFADVVKVTRQAIHRYKSGERIPEWPVLATIKDVTGGAVTADDFMPSQAVAS